MTGSRQVFELARRDFSQRARSRAFLISMLLTVGLLLTVGPVIALATKDADPAVVGLIGETPPGVEPALAAQSSSLDIDVVTRAFGTQTEAESALEDGDADVVVIDGFELVWRTEAAPRLSAAVIGAIESVERTRLAADLGLTAEEFEGLLSPVAFTSRVLKEPDAEDGPRKTAAYVGLMVLYISILIFGQFVLMGVMEEKQNRVVEVVLSRVRPSQVLAGKVIGIGLLGLIQVLTFGVAGLFTLAIINVADVGLSGIGVETFLRVLFWYLLGFGLYSVLYGALGATISRQEDMQGAVMVPVLLIIPGFFIGQLATDDPDALIAKIGSLIPLWAPMVMPIRAAVGNVPLWEIALSVGLIVVSIYGLVKLGGRIYAGAILKIGSKVKLRDAWRAASS